MTTIWPITAPCMKATETFTHIRFLNYISWSLLKYIVILIFDFNSLKDGEKVKSEVCYLTQYKPIYLKLSVGLLVQPISLNTLYTNTLSCDLEHIKVRLKVPSLESNSWWEDNSGFIFLGYSYLHRVKVAIQKKLNPSPASIYLVSCRLTVIY